MLSVCTDFPYHVAFFLQGVDLINDQTKRLVSLGIWTNLLPVCFCHCHHFSLLCVCVLSAIESALYSVTAWNVCLVLTWHCYTTWWWWWIVPWLLGFVARCNLLYMTCWRLYKWSIDTLSQSRHQNDLHSVGSGCSLTHHALCHSVRVGAV